MSKLNTFLMFGNLWLSGANFVAAVVSHSTSHGIASAISLAAALVVHGVKNEKSN